MTLMNRRALPILMLSSALLFAGCYTANNAMTHLGAGPDVCSGGAPNPYAPIVCIDDSQPTLPAEPPEVHVVNFVPGKQRSVINWFTKSGGNQLSVTFDPVNARCFVKAANCEGSHCLAIINPDATPGWRCKYSVKLVNKPGYFHDPIVEIDPCCPVLQ